MQLVVAPDPNLRKKCENPERPTQEEKDQSYEIMKSHAGIGISAPQVGSDKRFFWANDEFIVNPEITGCDGIVRLEEGCLSLPGKTYMMLRAAKIDVKYEDIDGNVIETQLDGMRAVVFQHEYDHLAGIMIDQKSAYFSEKLVSDGLAD